MKAPILFAAMSVGLLSGCTLAPLAPAGEVGTSILASLDDNDTDTAADLFSQAARRKGYLDRIYPVLYEAAQDRFREGDSAGSARVLRFMASSYPNATAVREALLYALLIERSRATSAEQGLLDEMEQTLRDLRARSVSTTAWIDLVETQLSIDRRRLAEAREAFDRFLAAWNGEPAELAVYVEEIDRYLRSR